MRTPANKLRRSFPIFAGLFLFAVSSRSAPFGLSDSTFDSPHFTARAYPGYCFSDGRGGLLWSFDNNYPGGLTGADDVRVGGLVRTTTNGVVDASFVTGPALREAMGVALQADGKILVGGRWVGDVAPNGALNYRVFRLFTNGMVDATYHSPAFGAGTNYGGSPRYMTVQPDGKLLAAIPNPSDTPAPNGGIVDFVRLNSDGSQDTNFHRPAFTGGVAGVFAAPVRDTNGAIYVAGGFAQVDGQSRQQLVRLHPDGTVDPTFVPSGFTSSLFMRGILLQPGGKVVISGRLRVNSVYYPLLRLNSDGSLDSTFNLVSSSSINFFRARVLRATADGKMLIVGSTMARVNSNGSLDNTFTRLQFGDASGNPEETYWFEQLEDGKIIVPADDSILGLGPFTINGQPFNGSVRLFPNGTLDTAYSKPMFQRDVFPTAIARRSDQRLLAAGTFDRVGSNAAVGLVQLNTNGTPDASFALGLSNVVSVLKVATTETDQTYALVQMMDPFTFLTSNSVVRLQSNGTVDAGFSADPASINDGEFFYPDLLMQGGLPLVVGSRAQALVLQSNAPVMRLLADGARDTNFQPNFALPGSGEIFSGPITDWSQVRIEDLVSLAASDIQMLATGSDGKLLAAIGTNASANLANYQLVRLNADGTLDNSFVGSSVSPAGTVSEVPLVQDRFGNVGQVDVLYPVRCLTGAIIQSNGAVLFCGAFTNVGGAFRPGIARLKPDFSLDPAFPVGTGPATAGVSSPVKISGLTVDAAGEVWVTGNFVTWDGFNAPGYVRLNFDGSVDTNCVPQSIHYAMDDYDFSSFSGTLPGASGDCYVFGAHVLSNDLWPRALSRLVRYPPPPLVPVGMMANLGFRFTFNSESGEAYSIRSSTNLMTWRDWTNFAGTGGQLSFTDPEALQAPKMFYRVQYQQ